MMIMQDENSSSTKIKEVAKMALFTKKLSAQAYFKAPEMNVASSACGTACGAGDK